MHSWSQSFVTVKSVCVCQGTARTFDVAVNLDRTLKIVNDNILWCRGACLDQM